MSFHILIRLTVHLQSRSINSRCPSDFVEVELNADSSPVIGETSEIPLSMRKYFLGRHDVNQHILSYYVLRDEMLAYYVNDIAGRLAARLENDSWRVSWLSFDLFSVLTSKQEIEATLHCIMSVHEAVDMEKALQLRQLFSRDIFGKFPSTGRPRIRRTALGVIGIFQFSRLNMQT